MNVKVDLVRIFAADLVLRWAYQMGKSPLLPLFAATLGAAEMMTGLIVAVSTFTGMILKPLFGMLSDRWGRRIWLLTALVIFSGAPFLYQFVSTATELFALRLMHGFATAIFGPVSLAYVADLANENRATRLAIFGMARSFSSLGAPLCAGLLLTYFEIQTVFTLIGFLSLTAMFPLFFLTDTTEQHDAPKLRLQFHMLSALRHSLETPAIWFAGLLELSVYLVTYAVKAFLPLFILSQDNGTILQAGMFFSLQEALHMLIRPIGGRFADRKGYGVAISAGMLVLALAVILLPLLPGLWILGAAVMMGAAQALVFPASVALLAQGTQKGHRGAGMGFYGALRNLGKVTGPVLAGALLIRFDFSAVFGGFAVCLTIVALIVGLQRHKLTGVSSN